MSKQTLTKQTRTIESVLREFMNDVEAVGLKQVGREWPDLLVTYNNARMALEDQRQKLG